MSGLQTRGKTYLARASNIRKYTEGRFDPKGLASEAPALDGPPHPPRMAPPVGDSFDPARPSVLLLHEDDLFAVLHHAVTHEVAGTFNVAGAHGTPS